MPEIDFTDVCTAYTETIEIKRDFETLSKEKAYSTSENNSFKMLCLMFTTYPKNVPKPKEYTVDDMLRLANDPILLSKYGTPFCVMSLFHNDRPALFVLPHALIELCYYMEQPSILENQTIIIKESNDTLPIVINVSDSITTCAIPEKYIYGCHGCLSVTRTLTHSCPVRSIMGADNPSYGYGRTEDNLNIISQIYLNDERIIKSWGKYESPFNSKRTKIAGYLYVSPTMFYTPLPTDRLHHRSKSAAFIGLRDITIDNIDLDSYERHSERKQDVIDTRKKYKDNVKKNCTECSVKETCHITFKNKKKYCSSPYPSNEEIDKHFLNDDTTKISKDTIVEILLTSGNCSITNPTTGRKCDAYISIHNDMYGLGFRVIARASGKILTKGTTDKEWIDFKVENNININYSDFAKNELHEKLKDATWYAKLLACAAIKQSPTRVSMFHSTAYAKAYLETTHRCFSVKFLWTSRRRLCPWNYEVKDWEDLFGHYGRIPGFR
jgi:hypothetical protein